MNYNNIPQYNGNKMLTLINSGNKSITDYQFFNSNYSPATPTLITS